MKRKICMSTGCLWNPYLEGDANKEIKLLSKLNIDGIEFLIGDAVELLPFKMKKETIKLLKNSSFFNEKNYKITPWYNSLMSKMYT